jgi:hypothetical protein
MAGGRPTKYSIELATNICADIATSSISLKSICEKYNIGVSTVWEWLADKKEFTDMYARAKQEQADYLIEELLTVANNDSKDGTPFVGGNFIQRDRLKIDTMKFIASKLRPDKYGDKLNLNGNISIVPISGMEIK